MELRDRVTVVTGGASGIGEALCRRFKDEGAKAVVVVDFDGAGAARVAESMGGVAMTADVAVEDAWATVPHDFHDVTDNLIGKPYRFTFKRRLGECSGVTIAY